MANSFTIRRDFRIGGNAGFVIADLTLDDGAGHTWEDRFQGELSGIEDAETRLTVECTARLARKLQRLKDHEIEANIAAIIADGSLASPIFNWSTASENADALRPYYQTSTRLEAIMIGDYLNTLTQAVIVNKFGITDGYYTGTLKPKLQAAAVLATEIRAEAGE